MSSTDRQTHNTGRLEMQKPQTPWNQTEYHIEDAVTYPIPEAVGLCMQIIGFIENIVVVILLILRPKLRKRAHEFFILCLSFSDLLVCSTNLVYYIPIYTKLIPSKSFCEMIYTGWVAFFGSSLFLCFLISLERFNAVKCRTHSIFAGKSKYYTPFISTVLLICYVVIIISSFNTTGNYNRCKLERMYSYVNMLIILVLTQLIIVLPLVILTILLYSTAVCTLTRLLRKHQRDAYERNPLIAKLDAIPSNYTHLRLKFKPPSLKPLSSHFKNDVQPKTPFHDNPQTQPPLMLGAIFKHGVRCSKRTDKLKTALTTVLIILVVLFFTFIPHMVIQMLKLAHIHLPVLELTTRLLIMAHPLVNPLLYVWRIKGLRKELLS
ncbi:uncharacterized protein LOC132546271 [Ylistrum balloti]|uniref:uncharacterized protein LOC132546271 n=1 Tax=Ylistrum balloti TaxID=509963 RepID=UPI002905CDD1|nr:uncharacterized protein LOC132546271 [Ylistrum balloti]